MAQLLGLSGRNYAHRVVGEVHRIIARLTTPGGMVARQCPWGRGAYRPFLLGYLAKRVAGEQYGLEPCGILHANAGNSMGRDVEQHQHVTPVAINGQVAKQDDEQLIHRVFMMEEEAPRVQTEERALLRPRSSSDRVTRLA